MTNILVDKQTGLIKHQGFNYTLSETDVEVKTDEGYLMFVFGTLNSFLCEVIELDEPINAFLGNKYLYKNEEVVANPDWSEE